jgi:hypothetical protein
MTTTEEHLRDIKANTELLGYAFNLVENGTLETIDHVLSFLEKPYKWTTEINGIEED